MNDQQVARAVAAVTSNWANQPLADSVRATWRRKLWQLTEDEFYSALDKWLDGHRAKYRPEPGDLMDIVNAYRPTPLPSNDWSQPHPDGPAPETDREMNLRNVAELRERFNLPSKIKPSER